MSIAPVETEYRGYRFRSRLEARWARLMPPRYAFEAARSARFEHGQYG